MSGGNRYKSIWGHVLGSPGPGARRKVLGTFAMTGHLGTEAPFSAGVKYNIYGVKKGFQCLLAIMRCARTNKLVRPLAARGRGSFASLCISVQTRL